MTDTFREILRLRLRHAYYGTEAVPVVVVPSDPAGFARMDLMLRRQGDDWIVVTDAQTPPDPLPLSLMTTSTTVFQVTHGVDWNACPILSAPVEQDEVAFGADAQTETRPRRAGDMMLCDVRVALSAKPRILTVAFEAMSSHWAYHLIGPGNDAAFVEDPDGAVQFETVDPRTLPDGRTAFVQRSRQALAAGRARLNVLR